MIYLRTCERANYINSSKKIEKYETVIKEILNSFKCD